MRCKNCHKPFTEQTVNYCLHCGARVIRNRLTTKHLIKQAGDEFFNVDNKPLKTFIHLITKPVDVIDGYIKGTRKKYVNPISFIAISLAFSAVQFFIINNFYGDLVQPLGVDTTLQSQTEILSQMIRNFFNQYQDYVGIATFISIPLMAFISYLVFFNIKKYNFVEHIVIYSYTSAATSFIGTFIILLAFPFRTYLYNNWYNILIVPISLLYTIYVLKQLFSLSWLRMLWKTLFFFIIGTIAYIMVIFILGVLMAIYIYLGGELPEPIINTIEFEKSLINPK